MSNYRIVVDKYASDALLELAVELSQCVALFSEGVLFPVISCSLQEDSEWRQLFLSQGDKNVVEKKGYGAHIQVTDQFDQTFIGEILSQVFDVTHSKNTPSPLEKKELSLQSVFGEGALKSRDRNRVFQGHELALARPQHWSLTTAMAMSAVVARIAMDNQSIRYPVFCVEEQAHILVDQGDCAELRLEDGMLHVSFDENKMEDLYHLLQIPDLQVLEEYLQETMQGNNFDGQWAHALGHGQPGETYYLEKISPQREAMLARDCPAKLASYKDEEVVFEDQADFVWEVDAMKERIKSHLGLLQDCHKLRIEIGLSENLKQRKALQASIESMLEEQKLTAQIQIVDSYKQGFSWMRDILLPQLKGVEIQQIFLRFSEFQKNPGEKWTSEAGAVPSYVNMNLDNEGKWFDMPIRLLQEWYPIDDILAQELQIDRERIHFEVIEGAAKHCYEVVVQRIDGEKHCYRYEPVFSERHYLDEFPSMGLVHPATGYLRIYEGEECILFETQKTDLEKVWDYYQSVILPKTKDFLDGTYQPIFSTLTMEMDLSETDESLPCRQDLLSAMDSFHEDLYFVGLDYFKLLGQTLFGQPFDAPGLILPIIHEHEGGARIRWRLSLPKARRAFVEKDGQRTFLEEKKTLAQWQRLRCKDAKRSAYVSVTKEDMESLKALKQLVESAQTAAPQELQALDEVILEFEQAESLRIAIPKPDKTRSMESFEVMMDDIYNYENYDESIRELAETKGILVSHLNQSYEGRDIHRVEYEPQEFTTSYKQTMVKPTIFIKARHHANEVSSTNSTFALIKKLFIDPDYREARENINFVFMPNQNPDGTEIHDRLRQEHPHWIYHISRFNALGKEFGNEFFKKDTIHSEALSMEKIYDRWLPDLYIDDHGVPTHEWCQQFSGYTAPAYKGFWLPRALLYGYFWYPQGEKYADNQALARELQDVIADAIGSVPEFAALNHDLKDRFLKYANNWLPKMFPADYYKDLIFYWIPFEADPTHRYLSIRFPDITTVAYTSEVADETASGAYLELCAKAHLDHNLAIIRHMTKRQYDFERTMTRVSGGISIVNRRKRK